MSNDTKRFGKSAIAIVISAVMLLSIMVFDPETIVSATVNTVTVDESTDVMLTTNVENTSSADENTITVDIQPEDIASSVVSAEDIQQEELVNDNNLNVKKLTKKMPESSGSTSKFYFANVFKEDDKNESQSTLNVNWENPYAYCFKGTTKTDIAMTAEGDLYYVEVDTSKYDYIIFHNGSSWRGKSKDLTLSGNENKIYVPETNLKNSNDVGFNGWWLTEDEYNSSINEGVK